MKQPKNPIVVPAAHASPLPPVASIPSVPEGEKALDGTEKQAFLKVYSHQGAEVDQAMAEMYEKRAELAKDLGTLAPDAEQGKALHARLTATQEVNVKAKALATYTEDQEALAGHAVMTFINVVAADIEHMATKNPQIAKRYPKVLKVVNQRREAIATGIAQAKAKAAEPKKA